MMLNQKTAKSLGSSIKVYKVDEFLNKIKKIIGGGGVLIQGGGRGDQFVESFYKF